MSREQLPPTDGEIREIYRRIACGVGKHGDFLRRFAEAVQMADFQNFSVLRPVAVFFIDRYNLRHVLTMKPVDE